MPKMKVEHDNVACKAMPSCVPRGGPIQPFIYISIYNILLLQREWLKKIKIIKKLAESSKILQRPP